MLIFVPFHVTGRVLGEDGDAALALERIGVHHAFCDDLIFPEGAGLPKHLVDEGRLPVVDVRDDGDVADFHSLEVSQGGSIRTRLLPILAARVTM